MADIGRNLAAKNILQDGPPTVALLPGSKHGKLVQGVPFCLAIAQCLHQQRSDLRFILPLAPTIDCSSLARYADPSCNPMVEPMGGVTAKLHPAAASNPALLKTPSGLEIELIPEFPAHTALLQCELAITTVGANTAELGSLTLPMIVLLPTQQLDAMRNWDGLPGLAASLPAIGSAIAKFINYLVLRQKRLFAWPNIWAGEEIVPELVGNLSAEAVADRVLDLLDNPEKLQSIRDRLLQVRGSPGAARRLVAIIEEMIGNRLD
jgi:lipid-A-disaccharide synthase